MKIKNNNLAISITPHNITLLKVRPIDVNHHMSNGIEGTREIFLGHYSDWTSILDSKVAKGLDSDSLKFLEEIRALFLMEDMFTIGERCSELESCGIIEFDNNKIETEHFRLRFFRDQVLVYFKKSKEEELEEEELDDVEVSPLRAMPMIGAFSFMHRMAQSVAMYTLSKKYHGSDVDLTVVQKDIANIKNEIKFLSLK